MGFETLLDLLEDYVLAVNAAQYGVAFPGRSNGAGGYEIEVVNDPGRWWIRVWLNGQFSSIGKAIPLGVPRDPQQRCRTFVINGELCLISPDPTALRLLYGNYANDAAVGNIPSPVEGGDKSVLGIVSPSSAGGMNVSISAYPAGGLLNPVDPVELSGDEPSTAGQFLWDVSYSLNGVVTWAQSSPVLLADVTLLQIADALAVTIPTGAYRLYAVSLGNGQTDINLSRFVNLQDDLVAKNTSALSVTDGSTTVTDVGGIHFVGATVTNLGGGVAEVDVTPGGAQYPTQATFTHDEATVTAGNALTVTIDSRFRMNFCANQNTPANGDTFQQTFVMASGSYALSVLGHPDTNRGKLDIYIDGVLQGTQDWYAAQAFNVVQTTSISVLTSGLHTLQCVVNGKNASSTNYFILLTKYWIN